MSLLNKESISLFKDLEDINEGFRIPDEAYVHGKEFECFEQLGSDGYFSNYWYGDKASAVEFAEKLASYFKAKYDSLPVEEDCYDFQGMVLLWHVGDKALVANINLNEDLAFYNYKKNIPKELASALKDSKLKHLLTDDNDNSCSNLIYSGCSATVINELFSCIAESWKESYISDAEDEDIKIKV